MITAGTNYELIPFPVLCVESTGQILTRNQASQDILPAETTSLLQSPGALAMLMVQLEGNDGAFKQDIHLEGKRDFRVHAVPQADQCWLLIFYEITEFKSVNGTASSMIADVAHDLKQPITSIMSFSDVLQASGPLSAKQEGFLARIRNTAQRMSEMVFQLLDVSKLELEPKLYLSTIDLIGLVRVAIEEALPRAEEHNIKIVLSADENLPTVRADASRIGQVLANLISNAVKYSASDTKVMVKVGMLHGAISVSVSDQGFGIAPEHLPHIFDRFYRVKEERTRRIEGTGLGLYITKTVVELHGGRITVKSKVGKGSTFTVMLPLDQTQPALENSNTTA